MMKIKEIFLKSSEILKNVGIETYKLDTKILLSFACNVKSKELFNIYERDILEFEEVCFNNLFKKRLNREPIANILEKKSFWNNDFFVNSNVLTPRNDSETLIEAVLENYKNNLEKLEILELGVGSGCLILTLLDIYKIAKGLAIDISEQALEIAKINSKKLKVEKRIEFLNNNWNDNIEKKFDIIISNPPYIPKDTIKLLEPEVNIYNPIISLDGGNDGLIHYRYLGKNLKKNVKNKTKIFLEIGKGQKNDIEKIFNKNDFTLKKSYKDLNNIDRILLFE